MNQIKRNFTRFLRDHGIERGIVISKPDYRGGRIMHFLANVDEEYWQREDREDFEHCHGSYGSVCDLVNGINDVYLEHVAPLHEDAYDIPVSLLYLVGRFAHFYFSDDFCYFLDSMVDKD